MPIGAGTEPGVPGEHQPIRLSEPDVQALMAFVNTLDESIESHLQGTRDSRRPWLALTERADGPRASRRLPRCTLRTTV